MATNRFYPQSSYINAITNAQEAVVTFVASHDFTIGQIISFRVTPDFGMFQLNLKRGTVLTTTSDTVTVDIDTADWDAFDYSALNDPRTTPPVAVPCCSTIVPGSKPPEINILDAFDNRRI